MCIDATTAIFASLKVVGIAGTITKEKGQVSGKADPSTQIGRSKCSKNGQMLRLLTFAALNLVKSS